MNSFAYYNGRFDKRENIKIPLSDRSIFFGDAVYDAAVGSYDRILWEDEHIERFLCGAKRLGIEHDYTKDYLSALLREIAIRSMLESYFIYFQISRNANRRTHSAIDCKANLLVTVDPIDVSISSPPMKLMTAIDRRYDYCDVKTTNLVPAVIESTKAEKTGYDEAVFIRNGFVTECAKSNISIIKQGRIITHPKTNHILPGITREHLLKICQEKGIPYVERPFTLNELFSADEILVTSCTKLCRPVNIVDGFNVGGGNVELKNYLCTLLQDEFCKIRRK